MNTCENNKTTNLISSFHATISMKVIGATLDFIGHAGFLITLDNKKTIAIDPYQIATHIKPVDYILITHSHYDHCSIKDITQLAQKDTVIITPPDAQSKITKVENIQMQVVEVGDAIDFQDFKLEVVPAYNVGKEFHPKSENWHGYLIKNDKCIIYHAGDTDNIPEMKRLSGHGKKGNEFVALLPVSGHYTMTAEEAASVAALLKPTHAIPMHYGAGVAGTREDALRFIKLCKEKGINASILEKI